MHPRPVRSPRLPWGTLCLTAALLGAARWSGGEAGRVEAAEGPAAPGQDLQFSPVGQRASQELAASGSSEVPAEPGRGPGTAPVGSLAVPDGEPGGRAR
ncbi:MAG: hypothetical protein ISQ08_12005 [Planctomycetes bacterium]|nr:hypothetical protein [Planctomycetota bacterium]